jgi:hypothetical protein
MAAGDVDGDGCADLLVGAPGAPFGDWDWGTDGLAFTSGCWPAAGGSLVDWPGSHWLAGWTLDVQGALLAVEEYYFENRGRASVFVGPLTTDAVAHLEVIGDTTYYDVSSAALLGPDGHWLLVGSQGNPETAGRFSLFDTTAARIIDLRYGGEADLVIETDAHDISVGAWVADVGDRDGDGEVDLGLALPASDRNSLHFFPSVQGGHIDDAPEIWHGEGADGNQYGEGTGGYTFGRTDLDGDGLDDALASSVAANGNQPIAGRLYVVPWRGPGEYWVEDDALARVEGELTYDFTGGAAAGGDLDGDGQDDLVVGAPGNEYLIPFTGRVTVFLGPVAGILARADADMVWVGQLGDYAGTSLAIGDLDGSGKADLAIGAPYRDGRDASAVDAGAVYVLQDPL